MNGSSVLIIHLFRWSIYKERVSISQPLVLLPENGLSFEDIHPSVGENGTDTLEPVDVRENQAML